MKKTKRQRRAESGALPQLDEAASQRKFVWWPWVAALAALIVVFEIYGPALNGPFVLDDLYFPFVNPQPRWFHFLQWIDDPRPLLMISFYLNYKLGGSDTYSYHATNVVLHFFVAVFAALIAMRLLEWAGADTEARNQDDNSKDGFSKDGPAKSTLGIFAGALFLVHPMQTESVAYIASRSEVLSVFFYYAAYCVFLYRRTQTISWLRAFAVLALFAAAIATKQHTLTLPALLLLTDLFWSQGSVRANRLLYATLAITGVGGGAYVLRALTYSNTAGLHVAGLTPLSYFYTQCRVVWTYVLRFVLPFGQNADPDVAISHTLLEKGAIFGALAWLAVIAAAWYYRKRFPLASFGILVYLLLVAPTSSFVPIADVLQERRLYLPFIGLALVCLEFLRRLEWKQRVMIEAPVLIVLLALTYQRSALWGDPVALWQDSAEKSPNKVRPRFQLADAYYQEGKFPLSIQNYQIAARLGPPDYRLLVNYGLALDKVDKYPEALEKLKQATMLERDPEAWTLMGQVYGQQHMVKESLDALATSELIDNAFEMTFAIRGNLYESIGNFPGAIEQYQHALQLDPNNVAVRQSLDRVQRRP